MASRVIGAIQRSISLSNTASVPIQKIANSTLPSTTPDQVCSQFIDWRKVSPISNRPSGGLPQQDRSCRTAREQERGQERRAAAPQSPRAEGRDRQRIRAATTARRPHCAASRSTAEGSPPEER